MKPRERYGSRLGMMLVMLGMAVGTGNIWRFPRIAAQNGGGEFLIPWVTFLFLWSIPLLLVEFGMGRKWRAGPVVAFARMIGPGWAWMGAFVAFVATAILFYYSVVAGWTFRYVLGALLGDLAAGAAFFGGASLAPLAVELAEALLLAVHPAAVVATHGCTSPGVRCSATRRLSRAARLSQSRSTARRKACRASASRPAAA